MAVKIILYIMSTKEKKKQTSFDKAALHSATGRVRKKKFHYSSLRALHVSFMGFLKLQASRKKEKVFAAAPRFRLV